MASEAGARIRNRYRIREVLAKGRFATTYLAQDEENDLPCVVKKLSERGAFENPSGEIDSLGGSKGEKAVELFEREGKVLASLSHPGIPRFVDAFSVQLARDVEFYLVQEYVEAPSLRKLLDSGRRFTESEVVRIALSIADILVYLHRFSPPVIHRDIKPSNVLYGADHGVHLIDFGAAKDRLAQSAVEGSTIVGTYGYMPLEQYEGSAVPASDVYSLGATLVTLLSSKEPSEIGKRGMRMDFRPHVRISKALEHVLDRALDPNWEHRYPSALELKADLSRLSAGAPLPRGARRRPAATTAAAAAVAVLVGVWWVDRSRTQPGREPVSGAASKIDPLLLATKPVPAAPSRPADATEPGEWRWLPGHRDSVMGVEVDSEGNVWIFGKQSLVRYRNGAPDEGLELKGFGMTPAVGFAAGASEVWLGGWRGEIVHSTGSTWENLPAPVASKVQALRRHAGRMYAVVQQRLLVLDEGSRSWVAAIPEPLRIETICVTRAGNLLAGGSSLYRKDGAGWTPLWKGDVRVIHEDAEGRLLIGTEDGVVTLGADGREIGRELKGQKITAMVDRAGGRLWVGTWTSGLFYRESGRWYRFGYADGLTGDDVTGLAVDRAGRLWVTLYGSGGVGVAVGDEVEKRIRSNPPSPAGPGVVFADGARAAKALLGPGGVDGQVAAVEVNGAPVLLLRNRYTEKGYSRIAFRRGDGAMAEVGRNWTGEVRHGSRSTPVGPPDPRPPDGPMQVTLDSKDRLWIGTNNSGLYRFDPSGWRRFGTEALLDLNAVTALEEDREGNLWVGTHPEYRADQGGYLPNLHRFDGSSWTHFSQSDGLAGPSTSDILILADGRIAVGTNGGVSIFTSDGHGRYSIHTLDDSNGLAHTFADSVSQDPAGRLWIAHRYWGKGVTWYDGSSFHRADSRQGLFADRIARSAHDAHGRIWIQADDGRVGVYPVSAFVE